MTGATSRAAGALLIALASATTAAAQIIGPAVAAPADALARDVITPHRFATPPVVDGRVGDAEWHPVAPLPLVNLYPSFQSPLTERTEIRLGYDAHHVYASIRAWDSEPARIRATTLYRDRWESDDEFVVILDTFGDGQSAAMFLVTPAGVRVDNQLTHDAEPGRGEWMNRDWNVPWDAAAVTLADGWSAEMRIPFSSLRFEAVDGRVAMRLKTYRYLPRKSENQMFPATRPEDGANPHFRPSIGRPVVFEGIRSVGPVYVQPYVAGTTAARGTGARDADAGVDVKMSPLRSTTLDLTLNTDFAQVEVDQLQVNLTRFPLRFPERRPFFLERAGLFAVGLGGEDTLFNSRRVGLTDDGQPRPIVGGARLVSRFGGWDVGAMTVQVGRGATGEPAENAGVWRAQRAVGRGHAVGGAVTTLRSGGTTRLAGAVDASLAIGRDRLSAVWATTSDEAAGPVTPSPSSADGRADGTVERSRAMLRWQRGAAQGVSYTGEYRFTGREFMPSLGFLRLSDAHEFEGVVRQSWRPSTSETVRRHGWSLQGAGRWRRADAVLEESRLAVEWNIETTTSVFASARLQQAEEDVPAAFDVTSGVTVAPGRYRSATGRLTLATPPAPLQLFGAVEAGGFYGGRRFGWHLEPTWSPSRHFQAWAVIDSTRLRRMPGGVEAASIDLAVVGVRGALNTHVFVDLNVQRASGLPAIGQLRFRWNLSEGHDLWVVAERGARRDGRTTSALTVKYTRLIAIGGQGV